jgi:hypothetical protein
MGTRLKRLAVVLTCAALAACASPASMAQTAPRFPAVEDFGAPGPFATVNRGEGPNCTIFRPELIGAGGLKHPIILWGNGTGTQPATYQVMLRHWASHGFVVAAANTPNAGTGQDMLACLDWLAEQNAASGNPYSGNLDLAHVGTSGHSQGGGGSIMAGRDPRITVTAPVQPYVRGLGFQSGAQAMQHGPMLLLSGGVDAIADPVRNQQPVFDQVNVPVFWATLEGAGHMVPARGDSGPFRPATTAWFRYHLMGDRAAGAWFEGQNCGLCVSSDWSIARDG